MRRAAPPGKRRDQRAHASGVALAEYLPANVTADLAWRLNWLHKLPNIARSIVFRGHCHKPRGYLPARFGLNSVEFASRPVRCLATSSNCRGARAE